MKRRLLLAALVLCVGAFIWALARSLPPVAITARFIARTNYPNGWIGCLIAVTNVTTNNLIMLVPMDMSMARGFRTPALPTNVFFCPVQVPVGGGKVAPFLQTEAHPKKVRIHFGQPRDHSGIRLSPAPLAAFATRTTARLPLKPADTRPRFAAGVKGSSVIVW